MDTPVKEIVPQLNRTVLIQIMAKRGLLLPPWSEHAESFFVQVLEHEPEAVRRQVIDMLRQRREEIRHSTGRNPKMEARELAFRTGWEQTNRDAIRERLREIGDSGRPMTETSLPLDGWRFREDAERTGHAQGWYKPALDDDGWRDAQIEVGWAHFLDESYIGVGWYRRTYEVPEVDAFDAAYLHFDGVDEMAWVWIDGKYVGQHNMGTEGWNVPFSLEVTDHLEPGRSYQLTVRVANTAAQGGIWRPVRLELMSSDP